MGVLVFGSWARGDAADGSDVDLLVVLDAHAPIVRSLYRACDEADRPLTWEGRRIEVHFVHLPTPGDAPAGLWAEAALEGLVLFDRGFELSRRLLGIRRGIAAGVVRRRRAHGVAPPRVHDVSEVLEAERARLPAALDPEIPALVRGSRQLRRDRELAFYGAEDLTPSGFHERADAEQARATARHTVQVVKPHVPG